MNRELLEISFLLFVLKWSLFWKCLFVNKFPGYSWGFFLVGSMWFWHFWIIFRDYEQQLSKTHFSTKIIKVRFSQSYKKTSSSIWERPCFHVNLKIRRFILTYQLNYGRVHTNFCWFSSLHLNFSFVLVFESKLMDFVQQHQWCQNRRHIHQIPFHFRILVTLYCLSEKMQY